MSEDLRNIEELLKKLLGDRNNPSMGMSSASGQADTRAYKDRVNDLIKSSKEASESFKRLNSGFRLTSRSQFEHRMALEDASDELSSLQNALRAHRKGTRLLTDDQLKEVEARRKELASTVQQTHAGEKFAGALTKWGGFLINYYTQVQSATISGLSAVMSTIQSGGSGFAQANSVMTMQLDIANAHAQQLATATQMAGMSVMALPGIGTKILGAGVGLRGQAEGAAASLKTMGEKAYNQILMTGGDQLLKAYKDITRAGVVVAGGADEMVKALSTGSGKMLVSFDQFQRMVQENGEALAKTNMGVGQAALMMGKVVTSIREKKLDRGLQALGISVEDFGGIVAQTMASMRYNNLGAVLDRTKVEQKSMEYAQQLATLSQLTGKSVKELKDRGKAAEREFGYQQYLAEVSKTLGPEKAKELKDAMDAMPKMLRDSVVEQKRFGGIRNEQGRVLAALEPRFASVVAELSKQADSANLNMSTYTDTIARNSKVFEDVMTNRVMGDISVASGKYAESINGIGETSLELMRINKDSVKNTREGVAKQLKEAAEGAKDGKPTMTQLLTDINAMGQTLTAQFQKEIIDRLPQIGRAVEAALNEALHIIRNPEALKQGGMPSGMDWGTKALIAIGLLTSAGQLLLTGAKLFPKGLSGTTASGGPGMWEKTKAWFKEKMPTKEATGPKPRSLMSAEEIVRDNARLKALESSSANAVKASKIASGTLRGVAVVGTALQVAATGKEVYDIQQQQNRGEISKDTADIKQTGAVAEGVGTLAAASAGALLLGKGGAALGTFIAGPLGTAIGGAVGAVLGGIGGAFMSSGVGRWLGEKVAGVWKSIKLPELPSLDSIKGWFTSAYDSVISFGSKMKDVASSSWDWAKNKVGWSSDKPATATSTPAKPAAVPVSTKVASLPDGLKMYAGGLGVSLMANGNFVTLDPAGKAAFSEVFTNALKSGAGGAGTTNTTSPSTAGMYDPKTKKGKVFNEADLIEYGKGDPMVYALTKLIKVQAEEIEVMRSLASKMGAVVSNTSDANRLAKRLNTALQ